MITKIKPGLDEEQNLVWWFILLDIFYQSKWGREGAHAILYYAKKRTVVFVIGA